MSFDSIKSIIEERRFNDLVGIEEDTWLEAKGRNPYNLGGPADRYELAKDVSAFANADGGFLIVGLTTTVLEEARTERITGLDPLPQNDFDANRYAGVIDEYVHPSIQGLNVRWVPVNEEATMGLGIIEVPPQSENKKYFLIANVVEEGATIKNIVFGVAKRNESSNDPFSKEDLYKYTQSGKSPVPQTLARIEQKMDQILKGGTPPTAANPEEVYAERAARILDETS